MRMSSQICSCREQTWMKAAAGSEQLSQASQGLLPAMRECGRDNKACFWETWGSSGRWFWPSLLRMGSLNISPGTTAPVPEEGSCLRTKPNHWEWQSRKMRRTGVPRALLSCWANQPQNPSPHGLLVLQDNKFPYRVSHQVGVFFTFSRKHCHWYSYPPIPLPRRNFW